MKKYGLIGKNINYSLSPKLHKLIANYNNINITYELVDILETDIKKHLNLLKEGVFHGFNVTIPYKEIIIKYLDKITDKAVKIGAVNTIYLDEQNNIIGDNTDYFGFTKLLEINKILDDVETIYILGSGGAAKTVYHVLKDKGFNPIIVSRDKEKAKGFNAVISYEDYEKLRKVDLLINCTPVGVYPKGGMAIKDSAQEIKKIVDLIYNPLTTDLMRLSNCSYNGLDMLIYQAIESQKIFFNAKDKINFLDNDVVKHIKEELENEFIR